MRKHATSCDATAAATFALRIRQTDASLHLTSAVGAGLAAYEDSARYLDLQRAVHDEFQPRSLHEWITAASLADSTWSQSRYPDFETRLLRAGVGRPPDPATGPTSGANPTPCFVCVFPPVVGAAATTCGALNTLEDRLHQAARSQAARLLQARRLRAETSKRTQRLAARGSH